MKYRQLHIYSNRHFADIMKTQAVRYIPVANHVLEWYTV